MLKNTVDNLIALAAQCQNYKVKIDGTGSFYFEPTSVNKWRESETSAAKKATNSGLDVGDVHAGAVVRVCTDDDRTVLRVERKIGDVDVARCLEDASRLPVKLSVVSQHNTNALEVRNQLLGAVVAVSPANEANSSCYYKNSK